MLLPIHPLLAVAVLTAIGLSLTAYAVGMALAVDRLHRLTHPEASVPSAPTTLEVTH